MLTALDTAPSDNLIKLAQADGREEIAEVHWYEATGAQGVQVHLDPPVDRRQSGVTSLPVVRLHRMAVPASVAVFWNAFAASVGGVEDERFYEAFCFGDNEELANSLGELVLRGTKRATAGAVWYFEAEGKRLPVAGDLSVVTDWSGKPLCVIETQSVEVVPFSEVSAEFAATEGEGDGSLSFWQAAHREFFGRECTVAGREFSESMLVACERFRVLYQEPTRAD